MAAKIALEVGIILILVIVNGLLSMSELAIVSARKARLRQWAHEKRLGASAAWHLAEHPEDFLATVQIGITLVAILSGALGGATLGEILEDLFVARGMSTAQAETWAVGIIVTAITLLSVVVGELLPKYAALAFRERVAVLVAPPMLLLSRLAIPLVVLLTASTRGLAFLLRIRPSEEPPVTEQEINILMQEGERAGVFMRTEQQLIERVLELDMYRVGALMTPRTEITSLLVADDEEALRRKLAEGHEVYPVLDEAQNTIVGLVEAREVLQEWLASGKVRLPSRLQPVVYVPENVTALAALQILADAHSRMGLVMDEYGADAGLVTLNDLLQQIVRDVPQQKETDLVRREDGSWLVDGLMPYQDLFDELQATGVPEGPTGYHTVGGLAMAVLGRIPETGDRFELGSLQFEVADMDGHRVDKLIVTPVPETD